MTLANLQPGRSARIVRVHAEPERESLYRLAELGFTDGVEVRMLRLAPLGDPVVVGLLGYELCIRKTEAECVEIEEPAPA